MRDAELHRARIVSSVAATVIALACGTNYVYSAWAPQFADKLRLSATESNLVGLAGNMGMYTVGIPIGLFTDRRGPRPAVLIGSLLLGGSYFYMHEAFVTGDRNMPLLLLIYFLSGAGGCIAFYGSIKTSALNWPHHRGAATAFPLAAFGLSAFFFSLLGTVFFPGDTADFLSLLAVGTFVMAFAGFFFLRVLPYPHYPHSRNHSARNSASYAALPGAGPDESALGDSQELRRHPSREAKASRLAQNIDSGTCGAPDQHPVDDSQATGSGGGDGPSAQTNGISVTMRELEAGTADGVAAVLVVAAARPGGDEAEDTANEHSSLLTQSSASSRPSGDVVLTEYTVDVERSHRVDIRGWQLFRSVDFWQQFVLLGLLSGIGLMTINNIGNDVIALWTKKDSNVDQSFLMWCQQMHVSILSICSFVGRLLSGVGSDFVVKVLRGNRVWCVAASSLVFTAGQAAALAISDPTHLWVVSALSGLGYGCLFGVFPSIVAESFGVNGLSQNWGAMTLAPSVANNVFNLLYGATYDAHSAVVGPDGTRACHLGIECYRAAYEVTLIAGVIGIVVTLWVIRYQHVHRMREKAAAGVARD